MTKILALGDVVGPLGTEFVCKNLRALKAENHADLVIVNGENCTRAYNLDIQSAKDLFDAGADVITGGNHTMQYDQIHGMLRSNDRLLRPHNYPVGAPGKGWCILPLSNGKRVLVINLSGQAMIEPNADNPYSCCQKLLYDCKGDYDFAVCDFHAESTGEKNAFFRHFDGSIAAMYGTHTHVQTADERLLYKGSACITDLGMCGAHDSVIGSDTTAIITRYRTATRVLNADRTEPSGDMQIRGALFTINDDTGYCTDVVRICYKKG